MVSLTGAEDTAKNATVWTLCSLPGSEGGAPRSSPFALRWIGSDGGARVYLGGSPSWPGRGVCFPAGAIGLDH